MQGFQPTVLGVVVYLITNAQINEALQSLLIIATLVYTVIKIIQLLEKKQTMVRILRWLANKLENFNNMVATAWNNWLKKIKM